MMLKADIEESSIPISKSVIEEKSENRDYPCPDCDASFDVESSLTMHRLRSHKVAPYRKSEKKQTSVANEKNTVISDTDESNTEPLFRESNAVQIVESVLESVNCPKKARETLLLFVRPKNSPLHSLDFVHILIQSGVKSSLAQLWGTLYRTALRDSSYTEGSVEYNIASGKDETKKSFSQAEVSQMMKVNKLEMMFERVLEKLNNSTQSNSNDGELSTLREEVKGLKNSLTDNRFRNLEALIKSTQQQTTGIIEGIRGIQALGEKWLDTDKSQNTRKNLGKIRKYIAEPLSDGFQMPKETKLVENGAIGGLTNRLDATYIKEI